MGQFLRGPEWASTLRTSLRTLRACRGVLRARRCGRSAARKSERRRTAPARCRGTYDERADGVHRSFGADEVARLEYAYEVLTRDVLLLTHKERDMRTTARCASGTVDHSSSCSTERHADGRSCPGSAPRGAGGAPPGAEEQDARSLSITRSEPTEQDDGESPDKTEAVAQTAAHWGP